MNPYAILGSGVGTAEAASLRARLSAWHDAMVAHERHLRTGRAGDRCDEECPHVEARTLWAEALATFGTSANELAFLRSRAVGDREHSDLIRPIDVISEAVDTVERPSRAVRSATPRRSKSRIGSSQRSRTSTAELRP
jgi:hypothetical protein